MTNRGVRGSDARVDIEIITGLAFHMTTERVIDFVRQCRETNLRLGPSMNSWRQRRPSMA